MLSTGSLLFLFRRTLKSLRSLRTLRTLKTLGGLGSPRNLGFLRAQRQLFYASQNILVQFIEVLLIVKSIYMDAFAVSVIKRYL